MLVKSANKFDIIRKTILLAFWQPSILVKGHIFLVTVSIYEEENKKKEEKNLKYRVKNNQLMYIWEQDEEDNCILVSDRKRTLLLLKRN